MMALQRQALYHPALRTREFFIHVSAFSLSLISSRPLARILSRSRSLSLFSLSLSLSLLSPSLSRWSVTVLKALVTFTSVAMCALLIVRCFFLHHLRMVMFHEPSHSSPCPFLCPFSCSKKDPFCAVCVQNKVCMLHRSCFLVSCLSSRLTSLVSFSS